MRSKFEWLFILITTFITLIFFVVIFSMFLIPSFDGFIKALSSNQMLFAIGLTLSTSVVSALTVVLSCIPMAYTLSRYHFKLKWFLKLF